MRYDSRPEPSRRFAVLRVQGLAPYGFDIEATVSWSSPDGGCGFSDN
ncbi:MAG: copper resistance protein B [Sulfurifustis sp.]